MPGTDSARPLATSARGRGPDGARAPRGASAPSAGKELGAPWGLQIAVLLAVLVYYRCFFKTVSGFVLAIDHTNLLFPDFVYHYYETGRSIFHGGMPSGGYFYPATFAILIGPLCALPLPWAELFWGLFELGASLAACLLVPYAIAPQSRRLILLHTFLMSTSVPLLHNFKWGQVSVPIVLLLFCAHVAYSRSRRPLAAGLFALAAGIKAYPVLFLAWFGLRRDVRFLVLAGAASAAALVLVPVLVLGPEHADRFQTVASGSALAATDGVMRDFNAQYFASVLGRWAGGARTMPPSYWPRAEAAGYALLAVPVALLVWMERRRVKDGHLWAFSLTSCSLPLLLKSSWTHYFAYLPIVQVFLMAELRRSRAGMAVKATIAALLVVPSMFLCNVAALGWFGSWWRYASTGTLLLSDLLALVAAGTLLCIACRRASGSEAGPSAS